MAMRNFAGCGERGRSPNQRFQTAFWQAVTRSRGRTSARSWSSVSTQVTGATAAPRQRCSSPGAIAESRRAAAPSSSSSTAATCRGSDVEVSEDAEDDSEDSDDRDLEGERG
jgi:hypothetical protein